MPGNMFRALSEDDELEGEMCFPDFDIQFADVPDCLFPLAALANNHTRRVDDGGKCL